MRGVSPKGVLGGSGSPVLSSSVTPAKAGVHARVLGRFPLSRERQQSHCPSSVLSLSPEHFGSMPPSMLSQCEGCLRGAFWAKAGVHSPLFPSLPRKWESMRMTWAGSRFRGNDKQGTVPYPPHLFCHSREGGSPSFSSPVISGQRSSQAGLPFSIRSTFHWRFHFLICFLRRIASIISPCSS